MNTKPLRTIEPPDSGLAPAPEESRADIKPPVADEKAALDETRAAGENHADPTPVKSAADTQEMDAVAVDTTVELLRTQLRAQFDNLARTCRLLDEVIPAEMRAGKTLDQQIEMLAKLYRATCAQVLTARQATESTVIQARRQARRADQLEANRPRTLRRAAAYRHALATAKRKIARLEQNLTETKKTTGAIHQVHGHDAAYWYRAWSREFAINTGYKDAGSPDFPKLAKS